MTAAEREAANKFLAFHRSTGQPTHIQDVVKLDPRGLVASQFEINLTRATEHMTYAHTATWCARNCLATQRPDPPLNSTILPNGWNFAVPHGEYGMGLDGQVFRLVQGAPHVSVSTVGARTVPLG